MDTGQTHEQRGATVGALHLLESWLPEMPERLLPGHHALHTFSGGSSKRFFFMWMGYSSRSVYSSKRLQAQ
jgi:hypothetical protein